MNFIKNLNTFSQTYLMFYKEKYLLQKAGIYRKLPIPSINYPFLSHGDTHNGFMNVLFSD